MTLSATSAVGWEIGGFSFQDCYPAFGDCGQTWVDFLTAKDVSAGIRPGPDGIFRVAPLTNWSHEATLGTNTSALVSFNPQPPKIIVEPEDQIVIRDTEVTLSVVATGGEPLTYAWYINNRTEPESTNSTLTTIAHFDFDVQVHVKNPSGLVKSRIAMIFTTEPPAANDDFSTRKLLEGYGTEITDVGPFGTKEEGEPDHGGVGRSVWFSWRAPKDAPVRFLAANGGLLVSVYTGSSVTNLTLETRFSTDPTSNNPVIINAKAGVEYQIAIDCDCGPGSFGTMNVRIVLQEVQASAIHYSDSDKWLTVSGPVNDGYVLESSTNLLNWSSVRSGVIPSRGFFFYGLPNATTPTRFYRARPGGE